MYSRLILVGLILALYNLCLVKADCPKPYSNCHLGKEGFINVHIVPHTHDDVGWLKTVDEYYYGAANSYQLASVQYILDTVIPVLDKDPTKRFVYVEMAFFWRWWNEQGESMKKTVRSLVKEGRLEFVIGAWCMNDEATTYYNDIIDQQTLGLKFILEEFGECARPRSAWQIDPFGHSREQASLFAQFGFDGLFHGRVDYQDFEHRGKTKTREGLWQASANLGKASQLFTGILPNGYNPPPGFCFDIYCQDDPMMDNPSLEDYNVDKKVDDFIKYTNDQRTEYKTNNLIMTMGSDFQYSNAHMWYKNLDKLIKYVNERQVNGSKINIFYSTPACYLYSLNQANMTWPVKTDDFFPYAHRPHSFWTGYFTSRPALKYFVRTTNNLLQATRHITAFLRSPANLAKKKMSILERAMGVAQHHDAVSGTEKQHVAYDYAKRLSIGTDQVLSYILPALGDKLGLSDSHWSLCPQLNISECVPVENNIWFGGLFYNPLARQRDWWVRIPITDTPDCPAANFQVYVAYGVTTPSEVVKVNPNTKRIPERVSKAEYEIVFKATLPPLDFTGYSFSCVNFTGKSVRSENVSPNLNGPFSLNNKQIQLSFDENGNLREIFNPIVNKRTFIKQNFCYYNSFMGNNSEPQFQASGAYIFRPVSNTPECLSVATYTVYHGEQFSEVQQTYNSWISQSIRLYSDSKHAEFNWQVGPIDVTNNDGKEVVVKFVSDLESHRTFYTDSNGREILKRVRDFRPTWTLNQTEQTAGNYYPINSRIFIRDEKEQTQLTLVTDRSQGGSSTTDGSLEVMLHRVTLNDDSLGVGEPINEKGSDGKGLIVKGALNLIFESTKNSARIHRQLAHEINSSPIVLFANVAERLPSRLLSSNGTIVLPSQLHLLTLMRDYSFEADNVLLVRIEHFYELNEDAEMSQSVSVDLKELFSSQFDIVSVKELALGANMPVEELNERLSWNAEAVSGGEDFFDRKQGDGFLFKFEPMQIRTFHLWYDEK